MSSYGDFCLMFRNSADAVALVKGEPKRPEVNGRVFFYNCNGAVMVRAEIDGLPKGQGDCDAPIFAFHIHNGGRCTGDAADPFSNVGGHYNPKTCPHPFHSGDMPPLFSAGGRSFLIFLTDRFTVPEILGKTVIIHGGPDDFTTQPSGNAGEKIACGIITSMRM